MVAGSAKWLAERFYQLKTGYCCTGDYLHWTKSQPTAQCWWCPHPRQTREHLLTGCPKWRKQQRTLWKEVRKETGKGRRWWNDHEPFADRRCSQAVLNFLTSTEVGKTVPAVEEDARSEASEWELQERAEREEERRAEAEALGIEEEEHPLFLPTPPLHGIGGRGVGGVFSFVLFFSRFLGGLGGGHKGSLHCAALRGLRPGNGLYPRHDLDRSHTSYDKTKKKKKI